MARLNFREIEPASGASEDRDQFEKFAKQFFESVLKLEIAKGPSRGPDGGVDLLVKSKGGDPTDTWLVSCKHFARSGDSVGRSAEEDIIDRLHEHGATTFVGFYSTIASSGLEQKLERLRDRKGIKFKLFNSADIESYLLDSTPGIVLAKRYFPDSFLEVWPQVLSVKKGFSGSDAIQVDGHKWIVPAAFDDHDLRFYANTKDEAVNLANEKATADFHKPLFFSAWKEAVGYFPEFFNIPDQGIDSATDWTDLPPKWEMEPEITGLKASQRWSLLAIWSFVNSEKVRTILRQMNRDASQQEMDLMSFEFLAKSTGTERKDFLTRMFAYCPW